MSITLIIIVKEMMEMEEVMMYYLERTPEG
jgi:hypothetical protein